MDDLISRSKVIDVLKETGIIQDNDLGHLVVDEIERIPTAYDVKKVIEEVKKLDMDGITMLEDNKYYLVRKKEVISLMQTNGVCNGRYTCAECFKRNCPLSTEKTISDKWGEEIRSGGVE